MILKRVILGGIATLTDAWDRYVVDGAVNSVAALVRFEVLVI